MKFKPKINYLSFIVIIGVFFTFSFIYVCQVKAQEDIGKIKNGTEELEEIKEIKGEEETIKEPLLPQELQKETTEFKLEEIKKESWIEQIKNLQVPSQLKIISRNQWGANENWRFVEKLDEKGNPVLDEKGNAVLIERWPREYTEVKKFIIHHTATEIRDVDRNGKIDEHDYEAIVKGIYRWQALVFAGGWGDIGYNFLIDPLGNIYEGKFGGEGVVAGHAVRDRKCNK